MTAPDPDPVPDPTVKWYLTNCFLIKLKKTKFANLSADLFFDSDIIIFWKTKMNVNFYFSFLR